MGSTLQNLLKNKAAKDLENKTKSGLSVVPKASPDLDDQKSKNLGDQNIINLDDQRITEQTTENKNPGRPNEEILGDQGKIFGRPNTDILDDKTTKKEIRSSKQKSDLVDKTTKKKKLDDQNSEKKGNWEKYERARSTDRIGLRPNAEILEKFKLYCVKAKLTMTEFFEAAGLKFIDLDDQTKGGLDDKTPYDDRRLMIMSKTKPPIINLYQKYNVFFNPNTKWKPRDDLHGQTFNDVDLRIIELGIIQAQINKYTSDPQGSINSFKFYLNEIAGIERLSLDEKTLDVMIKVNRQHWKNITGKTIDLKFLEDKTE